MDAYNLESKCQGYVERKTKIFDLLTWWRKWIKTTAVVARR
jgi:hypothetical protein